MTSDELDSFLLERFSVDLDAAHLLMLVSRLVRLVDDVADGEAGQPPAALARIMELALVRIPANPFYAKWGYQLAPLLVTIHAVWATTDDCKEATAKQTRQWGFIWRDGIELFLYHVGMIVGGVDFALNLVRAFVKLEHGEDSETCESWELS